MHSVVARSIPLLLILVAAAGCGKEGSLPHKPQLYVDRDAVTFGGQVYIGAIPQDSLVIQNNGLEDLIISSATLAGDNAFTNVGPTSTQLKSKEHTFVTFYFGPTQARPYSATFTIVSNADNTPTKVINLAATGVSFSPDGG